MKRLGFFSKFAESKSTALRSASAGFAFAFVVFGLVSLGVPVWNEFKTSFAYRDFQKYGVLGTYQRRFFGTFMKMKDFEQMDRENHELQQRVAILEKNFELERARNASAEMKEITEELSDRIKDEAGNELARVLAAIPYNVPTHLLPHQQYALALGYFRKGEYEQAAVLFHHLLNLQDDTSYQRGEVQLLSAISWYHLKNYKLSKHFLRVVAKGANQQTSLYRTAVLWEAILAKAEGNRYDAQRKLTAALAQFPHSEEASWINTRKHEVKRAVEAKHAEQKHIEQKHIEQKHAARPKKKHGLSAEAKKIIHEAGREVAGRSEREPNQAWIQKEELKQLRESADHHPADSHGSAAHDAGSGQPAGQEEKSHE